MRLLAIWILGSLGAKIIAALTARAPRGSPESTDRRRCLRAQRVHYRRRSGRRRDTIHLHIQQEEEEEEFM